MEDERRCIGLFKLSGKTCEDKTTEAQPQPNEGTFRVIGEDKIPMKKVNSNGN